MTETRARYHAGHRRAGPRFSRKDANHDDIVRRLRMYPGVSVWSTCDVGAGYPDLNVLFRGRVFLVELKRPGHRTDLTPHEEAFHAVWPVIVAEDVPEILEAIGWVEAQR